MKRCVGVVEDLMTWRASLSRPVPDGVLHYALCREGKPLTWTAALRLLADHADFRSFLSGLLADAPFSAYRWETPPVTNRTLDRPFEFVLLNAPFLEVPPDPSPFAAKLDAAGTDAAVTVFSNLGGDAVLVVPCARADPRAYGHLAAFVRAAPPEQVHALWRAVAREMTARVGAAPVWLSTAGGGVDWLHVRLDSRPKYYGHRPYRTPPPD